MPSNRRTRRILVDERHCECVRINACPGRDPRPERRQKLRQRLRGATIVGLTKECDSSPRHHAAHFEVGERDMAQRVEQFALIRLRDEVLVIPEARRDVLAEKTSKRGHAPVSHSATRDEFAARCAPRT